MLSVNELQFIVHKCIQIFHIALILKYNSSIIQVSSIRNLWHYWRYVRHNMLKKCDKCGKDFVTNKNHLLCHDCWMREIEKTGGMTDDA